MNSDNALDRLLDTTSEVDSPSTDVLQATRTVVMGEADATAARTARIVHLRRRHRRLTIGVAAAAIAGIMAVPLLSQNHAGVAPNTTAIGSAQQAPVVQQNFTTVAQVLDAAAANSTVELGDAPYWKVESRYIEIRCDVESATNGSTCAPTEGTRTEWTGNGRQGVIEDTAFPNERPAGGPGTISVGGQTMTWSEFNARTWTDAQLASLVADPGPSGKEGRASANWYAFKNTFDFMAASPVSPTIRKQFWAMLEKVPGVTLVGQRTDHAGRTGWEISISDPTQGTLTYIIDTTNGMLLEAGGSPKAAPGTETYQTFLSAGPAYSAPSVLEIKPAPPTKADCAKLAQSGPKLTQCMKAAQG